MLSAALSGASLKRFVYEMEEGDIIYVKQGPRIVGKGAVSGPYQFDKKNRIVDPYGCTWQHQRRVKLGHASFRRLKSNSVASR